MAAPWLAELSAGVGDARLQAAVWVSSLTMGMTLRLSVNLMLSMTFGN